MHTGKYRNTHSNRGVSRFKESSPQGGATDLYITHHETRSRCWLRGSRVGRVNLRVSLLLDRRLLLRRITGSFQTVDGIRASLQRRRVITFYRRRWEERGAGGRIGARIVILPPTIYFAGDAQTMRVRIVRRYLQRKEENSYVQYEAFRTIARFIVLLLLEIWYDDDSLARYWRCSLSFFLFFFFFRLSSLGDVE